MPEEPGGRKSLVGAKLTPRCFCVCFIVKTWLLAKQILQFRYLYPERHTDFFSGEDFERRCFSLLLKHHSMVTSTNSINHSGTLISSIFSNYVANCTQHSAQS